MAVDRPTTIEAAAALLRDHGAAGRSVQIRGGGTKLGWGRDSGADAQLDTRGLNRIVAHNTGDFTAVLEAGVPLAEAQRTFAEAGQMLALDPPLGAEDGATIGGVIASADCGPLRHRYGAPRDLVVGATVCLSDGAIARSGGTVIKNVAGYDLAKLFAGSFGTLGLIAQVALRLHPRPERTVTASGWSDDPDRLAAAAGTLAALPLEADALDIGWSDGAGRLLARFGGAAADRQAAAVAQRIALERVECVEDDAALWRQQRERQRSADGIVLKVSGRPSDLPRVLRAARDASGTAVARVALGLSWLALPADADVIAVRAALAPRACTVRDGAAHVADPWPPADPGASVLMGRVRARFDPQHVLRSGVLVGGA